MNNNKHHFLMFGLLGLLAVVVICSLVFKANLKKEKTTETPTQPAVVENQETGDSSERFYSIKVEKISPDALYNLPETFSIVEMFGLKKDVNLLPLVFYDLDYIKFGSPSDKNYSGNYYLQLQKGNSKDLELKAYRNSLFEVTISPIDKKIIPYLKDVQYCEADSDCKLSSNFCNSDSYNKYREAATYGCEGQNGATSEEARTCNLNTQHAILSFTGSKCIANKCTALGRTITCEEGALP